MKQARSSLFTRAESCQAVKPRKQHRGHRTTAQLGLETTGIPRPSGARKPRRFRASPLSSPTSVVEKQTSSIDLVADPQTDVAPGWTRGRHVRSRYRCSMCSAIHINSRSWLRSSSTHEPSDPPPKVVFGFFFRPRRSCPTAVRKSEKMHNAFKMKKM